MSLPPPTPPTSPDPWTRPEAAERAVPPLQPPSAGAPAPFAETPRPYAPGRYAPLPVPFTTVAARPVARRLVILAIAGAVLVCAGSLMPWVTVRFFGVEQTVNGIEQDGSLTITFGLMALGVLIVSLTTGATWPVMTSLVLFVVAALIAVVDMVDVVTTFDSDAFDGVGVQAEIGIGLYVVLLGAVAGAVVTVVALATRRR